MKTKKTNRGKTLRERVERLEKLYKLYSDEIDDLYDEKLAHIGEDQPLSWDEKIFLNIAEENLRKKDQSPGEINGLSDSRIKQGNKIPVEFIKLRKKDIRGNFKVTVDPKKFYKEACDCDDKDCGLYTVCEEPPKETCKDNCENLNNREEDVKGVCECKYKPSYNGKPLACCEDSYKPKGEEEAHNTERGYCCACEYDIAGFKEAIKETGDNEYIKGVKKGVAQAQVWVDNAIKEERRKIRNHVVEFAIENADKPDEMKGLILYTKLLNYLDNLK